MTFPDSLSAPELLCSPALTVSPILAVSLTVCCWGFSSASAQEVRQADESAITQPGQVSTPSQGDAAPTERETKLAAYLNQSQFVGRFTVDGKPDASPKPEAYTISRCEKLPAKDMYRLTAKITYGDTDTEVPLDLKIVWAENTPVITIDSMWIPGMGTFSSRVMIHKDHYAGTWTHDDKGGHLFGTIRQLGDQ
ncbi:hypothetical protein V7x_29330 [Crateriforma conspicua]|uniref:Uncharacterized protein n=1 Tax=Crateriforma conspicua TaxID=2527996 RepID=A0A5C6FWT5_9PLAN|nr:hypothetical protein [Crateriforma conspicua]TWU67359.1 hypothetical protein V7x_29330 [Crateriforma conspicua]